MSPPEKPPSLDEILKQLSTEANVPVSKNSQNTIDLSIVPVIVVPGLMGTRLEWSSDGAVWDPDSDKVMFHDWVSSDIRDVRERFASNSASILNVTDPDLFDPFDRRFRDLVAIFYGSFLKFLAAELGGSCPVHAVGYDWTQSNAKSAAHLDAEVQRILKLWGAKKVVIVTHSMGGLVSRAACLRPGFTERVAGIVHTVQPVLGASLTYRQFLTGSTSGKGKKFLSKEDAFDKILGDEWWKYLALMSVLPGPLELMPNDQYQLTAKDPAWLLHSRGSHSSDARIPVAVNSKAILSVYADHVFPGVIFDRDASVVKFDFAEWTKITATLRVNLTQAAIFHNTLGLRAHPTTSVLASIEFPANEAGVSGTTFDSAPFFASNTLTSEGDGTVPRFSAEAIDPREDDVVVAAPVTAKPKRKLVGKIGEHKAVLDNAEARAFIVDNVRYFVQKAKA